MRYIKFFIFYILISTHLFSQSNNLFVGILDTSKASVTVDFEFVNNLVVIPLKINESDTLNFILDTGIRPTLLTYFSDSISFQVGKEQIIRGLGSGDDLVVYHTFGNNIIVSDVLKLTLQNVFVLNHDRFDLSKKMGMQINGIIGSAIFEFFIVKIDFIDKKITFYNPQKFQYQKKYKKWINIPLIIYNSKPYATFKIAINSDTTITSEMLIDLGASDALWLLPGTNDSIPKNKHNKNLYLGQGLNGDIYGYQGKVDFLFLNNNKMLKNVTVSYPDTGSVKVSENYDIAGRSGTIGSEILRRFTVIIDYPNNRLLLKRNSHFNDKFNFDLSGIDIETPFPGLKFYTIFNVHENSPASDVDLRKGDKIYQINYQKTINMSFNEILQILNSKIGRKIKIVIIRDNVKMKKIVVLRDYRIS